MGVDRSGDRQAVQRNAIPTPALDVPRQNRFIAYEVDLTIRETLPGINVGAASLDVVTADLLSESRCSKG